MATEDINIAKTFKNVLGDVCVTIPKEFAKYDGRSFINAYHIDRENDYYLRTKEYLIEMAIIAKCNAFITARCSGASGVMMMAENFENVYAFNLGSYGILAMEDFEED